VLRRIVRSPPNHQEDFLHTLDRAQVPILLSQQTNRVDKHDMKFLFLVFSLSLFPLYGAGVLSVLVAYSVRPAASNAAAKSVRHASGTA
jgi:hypothetical protein